MQLPDIYLYTFERWNDTKRKTLRNRERRRKTGGKTGRDPSSLTGSHPKVLATAKVVSA